MWRLKSLFLYWNKTLIMRKRIQSTAALLASFEIWVVAPVVVASIASARALPIAVVVAGIFWAIRGLASGQLSVRTPADWGIALLVLMLPITLWATPLPDTTRPNVYRLLIGIALYYAIVNWTISRARVRRLMNGMVLGGLFLALSVPFTVHSPASKLRFIPTSLYAHFSLLVSDTVDPNIIAGFLLILLPSAITILLFAWRHLHWAECLLAIIALLVIAGMLLLTQSRGALMGLGAALAVMALLYWRWSGLLLLPLAVTATFIFWEQGIVTLLNAVTSSSTLGSLESRLELWSHTFYIIQDFSFTGIGMGSFALIVDMLYPLFLSAPGSVPHTHNLFLQLAVDVGLPGLIGWLAILMLVVMGAWQLYRHGRVTGDDWTVAIGVGLLCSQVALVGHGLTDAVTWATSRPSPIVWGIWGLTIAAWRVLKAE